MSVDQQIAGINTSPLPVYNEKYMDFVDDLLKEAVTDFKKEKKCM